MDLRGRLHDRFFRTRTRRRSLVATLGVTSVVSAGLVFGMAAGADTTNGERIVWSNTQCLASVFGSSLVQPQDVAVQAVVPNNVATSAAYSVSIPGGTTTLPASAQGFTITGFKDVSQTYMFRGNTGSPQITGAFGNGPATSNGNPITYTVTPTTEGTTIPVTSAAWTNAGGGTITYNTAAAHGLAKVQTIDITGFGKAAYNFSGVLVDAVPTPTSFTVAGRKLTIATATWSGGVITYTTTVKHSLINGQDIQIQNATPSRYNGAKIVTGIVSETQFTIAGGATDPGAYTGNSGAYVQTLGNPGTTGATLGSAKTLTTVILKSATAEPGELSVPNVTVNLTAPAANSTVTTYTASITVTAQLTGPGDTPTVCTIPHANPQTDGISATLVGTGGPTTTSYPTCRPPDVCATSTTTLPPAPAITSIAPTSGSSAGGTSVTITGTNLTGATAVNFGATPATTFTVNSGTSITATAPAHAAGAVDVSTTTPGGTSANTAADDYTYVAGPTITSLTPTTGPAAGGTSVTIAGTGFTGASAVSFGGTAATFTVNNATQITATAPAHAAGTVDVSVTAPSGTTPNTVADDYTYAATPQVTNVAPGSGPTAGGTVVTIGGTGFTGATAVSFGGTAATTFTVDSASQITATTPAHAAGAAGITVTTPGGTSNAVTSFIYVAAPTVTSVTPASGPTAGGTSVTIAGTNLTGASAVSFGGIAATTFTVNNANQITATAPAHAAGTVDVTVTTAGGTTANTAADDYTYVAAPTVTNVAPGSGPTGGGTSVTITGTGFSGATAVSFGATPAAAFVVDNAGQITATAPAHAAGTVNVTVTTAGGTTANTAADDYTYVAAPTVTSVTPNSGPTTGGTSVTIAGTNLGGATAVSFGGTAATTFTVDNANQITATAPAHAVGAVDVTVTTVGGTSATGPGDQYTYTAVASGCGTICITVGDKAAIETDGTNTHPLQFPVTLSEPSTQPVTVHYTVVDGSATGGLKAGTGDDYKIKSGTITFKPSVNTGLTPISKTIAVTVFSDTEAEGDQTLSVILDSPTGGPIIGPGTGTGLCGATAGCATGTILNDDVASGFTLGVGDGSIFSARSGKQSLKLPVYLSAKALTNVTVDYVVLPGTATWSKVTEGGDYGGKTAGTLTFTPGQTSKSITSPIYADASPEADQGYTVVLSNVNGNGTGVTLIRVTGNGTILGLN